MTNKTDAGSSAADLADDPARRAIREDLATTILVEAAAGTGKTASLVQRMVALLATGRTSVDRLSAVTFTIKAAGELRQRFQNALESALEESRDDEIRARLRTALANLDSCFLGTIHSFGARLLRERPVEAGVDPAFTEMDEPEDGVARSESWDRYAQRLFLDGDSNLKRLLEQGVPLEDLRDAYKTLCENSDVEPAIGPERPEPDFGAARHAVGDFLELAVRELPADTPDGGWTDFQQAVSRARRLWALLDVGRPADFAQILKVLRPSSVANKAGRMRQSIERLRQDVVKPALQEWEEFLYPQVMTLLSGARKEYEAWRRQNARLNFQDLLLLARNLLRDDPDVRRAMRERFTPILVDEFQDTDPIQAEILFYLTGENSREKDWRKLDLVPGSLFVVGDPKQSIYRFRRADFETYQAARQRIAACGRVVTLSTNFRSTAGICEWINGVFSRPQFFPESPRPEQAAWGPFSPWKPGPAGIFRLDIRLPSRTQKPIAAEDARRIAQEISGAVARGEHKPGDFLILVRRRKFMSLYASELERRAIPYEIGGGGAFRDSDEISDLLPLLQTLADPDNPVPFVAALRGPVFGVDDEALYRFVKAGGRFHFRRDPPREADPRIARACTLLKEGAGFVETLPPGAAIARLVERLGWTALAASRELGDSRTGNLLKALAFARKFSGQGKDFPAVVAELSRMTEEDMIEQMGIEPGKAGSVRLMTLHGAKGLEAPVVFLADPTGDSGKTRDYWIDRSLEPPRGYLRVARKSDDRFSVTPIARPPGWNEKEEIEKRFDQAELIRLLYVGVTRAQEKLVVSVFRRGKGDADGPWARLDPHLPTNLSEQVPALVSEAPAQRSDPVKDLDAFRSRRASIRAQCGVASLSSVTVTALTHAKDTVRPGRERTGRGMEWGRIVHRLLEALMRDPNLDARSYAKNLFVEEERSALDVEDVIRLAETVTRSPLWQRARASARRFVEVPFGLMVPTAELATDGPHAETLLQGAIDLVFEENGGWVVVDYKSDTVSGNLAELSDFYRPQIAHYRRYWEKLTGRPTKAVLYFIETSDEVWLDDQ